MLDYIGCERVLIFVYLYEVMNTVPLFIEFLCVRTIPQKNSSCMEELGPMKHVLISVLLKNII